MKSFMRVLFSITLAILLQLAPSCTGRNMSADVLNEQLVPVDKIMFVQDAAGALLREGPDSNSGIICTIPHGEDVYVIAAQNITNKETGRWLKVVWGYEGWVMSTQLHEGSYIQNFFIAISVDDKTKGFAVEYNSYYVNKLAGNICTGQNSSSGICSLDADSLSTPLPVHEGDRIKIITSSGKIKEDTVKSFHLIIHNGDKYIIFLTRSRIDNSSFCVKKDFLDKNSGDIHVIKNISEGRESALFNRNRTIDALIKPGNSIGLYNAFDERIRGEYEKNPAAFIISNNEFTVYVWNSQTSGYALVYLKCIKYCDDNYDAFAVIKNDKVIDAINGMPYILFTVGNRLFLRARICEHQTAFSADIVAELDDTMKILAFIGYGN